MNSVQIVGNLGQDPELRYTQGGTAVCNLRVATNERKKDGDNWVDHTEWHNVVVWGRQAENCEQFLAKGRKVGVVGRLQTRQWEDRDGNSRYTTEIVANYVEFLGGDDGGTSRPKNESDPQQNYDDVDIPF